jgi:hypothetical protein
MTLISDTDPVVASLDPFAELPRWLAEPMDGARVGASLTQQVPELADGRLELLSCRPERLRAKESEWLARYRLSVRGPDGEPRDVVLVGTLWAPTQDHPGPDASSSAGAAFGEEGWSGWLPDLRLELQHEVSDEALPALPMLTEPGAAAELLQPVLRAAGYDRASIATCDPVVVRYKPGSRCTVVVGVTYAQPSTPPPPRTVVLKTHQGDKGQTAWEAMTALWEPPSWRGVLDLAEPLAFLPEERILVQGPIREELTLKELARQAFADGGPEAMDALRGALSDTGRALATLHQTGAVYGRTATFEDELVEVRDVIDRLGLTVPQLQGAAAPLLQRLEELAAEHPADPIVPAHHDFRPAQVLLHPDGLGFIDFDGASMAEPALDLGRFRAKLRDIGISSLLYTGQPLVGEPLAENLGLLDDLCEQFLASYLEHATVSRQRVLMWETCDLVTGMLHAWTKVRLVRLEPRLAILRHQLQASGLTGSAGRAA